MSPSKTASVSKINLDLCLVLDVFSRMENKTNIRKRKSAELGFLPHDILLKDLLSLDEHERSNFRRYQKCKKSSSQFNTRLRKTCN